MLVPALVGVVWTVAALVVWSLLYAFGEAEAGAGAARS